MASSTPFQAVALKDLSSMPPVSVTWQAFAFAAGAAPPQADSTNAATNRSERAANVFFCMSPTP